MNNGVPPEPSAVPTNSPLPSRLDLTVPGITRVYDGVLGGKDNRAPDRATAEKLLKAESTTPIAEHDNLTLFGPAAGDPTVEGIGQFPNLGSRMPRIALRRGRLHPGSRYVADAEHQRDMQDIQLSDWCSDRVSPGRLVVTPCLATPLGVGARGTGRSRRSSLDRPATPSPRRMRDRLAQVSASKPDLGEVVENIPQMRVRGCAVAPLLCPRLPMREAA
ncbi:SAM-dependent methyltransferase [Streptosporangium lutulentum]|uniref:Uncharacterized protein n=1 Tax=Streptosporangium lutulentum TaxID=1461250 RepID=A0ABT9QUF5_9ACTN|nr:SAM-dependent methyltransferase [Streptosporangium lutulentum]MDP9850379.1 hypothetical protein [Streptosporangium lutulentum]